eukprot:TRINITY_DN2616_c0_g6_i3.p2 TRINITY_DN2616_c0_g6~~TRINITY_DN2616_c0_g6_i3.p2  ORF type:complete len:195 (-),score=86.92 TRINITY_DN2616_c0_g6_i3:1138-1722(-)
MEKQGMDDEEIKEEIVGDEDMEDDCEQEFVIHGDINKDDEYFDMIVSHIQDIVFDPQFAEVQNKFFDDYCNEFEDTEENKIAYTKIFQSYRDTIEFYIEKRLMEVQKDFRMANFLKLLEKRADQVDDHLADTLLSFTDFLLFKQLILERKPMAKKPDGGLAVAGTKAKLHSEEQSDGEEMPDIMLDIKPYHKKK